MSQRLYPVLAYNDPRRAIAWLGDAFGLESGAVHEADGTVVHAELRHADATLMLGQAGEERGPFAQNAGRSVLYVVVDDVDAHCARARAADAEIITEPRDTEYGSREYAARDVEGNVWSFGTYVPSSS